PLVSGRPPTQTYPLALHDALPIYPLAVGVRLGQSGEEDVEATQQALGLEAGAGVLEQVVDEVGRLEHGELQRRDGVALPHVGVRSAEHTSELQSRENLVCRLLLEK